MGARPFCSYLRVSTTKQGERGLGIEAQRAAVAAFVLRREGRLLAEYIEVESGRKSDRPKLEQAVAMARAARGTLIVAKLDRLSRDAKFLLGLIDSGIAVAFCDLPEVSADDPITGRLILTVMSAIAEFEGRRIGQRIKEAYVGRRRRGDKLGAQNANIRGFLTPGHPKMHAGPAAATAKRRREAAQFRSAMRPILAEYVEKHGSLERAARALTAAGWTTQKGAPWTAARVCEVLQVKEWEGG